MNSHHFVAGLLVSLAPPLTLNAQLVADSSLKKCAAVGVPIQRLQCYDGLAKGGSEPSTAATLPGTKVGNWAVSEKINPIDDSKTVSLMLQADEGRTRFGQAPVLIVRCQSGKVEAFISWLDYMGSDASVITSRFGTSPPERKMWSHSTDERATFYPGDDVKFLESLLLVDRFVAQATPYSESPITAVFLLSGLTQAVAPLRAACGLKS